jgi:hypothetical protein
MRLWTPSSGSLVSITLGLVAVAGLAFVAWVVVMHPPRGDGNDQEEGSRRRHSKDFETRQYRDRKFTDGKSDVERRLEKEVRRRNYDDDE